MNKNGWYVQFVLSAIIKLKAENWSTAGSKHHITSIFEPGKTLEHTYGLLLQQTFVELKYAHPFRPKICLVYLIEFHWSCQFLFRV